MMNAFHLLLSILRVVIIDMKNQFKYFQRSIQKKVTVIHWWELSISYFAFYNNLNHKI